MREETVTKIILDWLEENKWTIICYDFPQSGTGVLLHPNIDNRKEKNKGGIIPDIIAVKGNTALFFENKDRFFEQDFDKLHEIKTRENYSNSLDRLLKGHAIEKIIYGIGIPESKKEIAKARKQIDKIDFLLGADENKQVFVHYDGKKAF